MEFIETVESRTARLRSEKINKFYEENSTCNSYKPAEDNSASIPGTTTVSCTQNTMPCQLSECCEKEKAEFVDWIYRRINFKSRTGVLQVVAKCDGYGNINVDIEEKV